MVDAMTYQARDIAISNNSWGPTGGSAQITESGDPWQKAIDFGLASGRNGLGTIYVFGGGNDATYNNRSDYNGFANYNGVIAVGGTTGNGKKAPTSAPGSNLLVSAPAGDSCAALGVVTTDLSGDAGTNNPHMQNGFELTVDQTGNYTQCGSATSVAAPIVSGVAALILQANPSLGWRDVKAILASTARKNDAGDLGWTRNGGGYLDLAPV
jgi:proprotein convertase subtilisin/kexin type 2